MARPDTGTSRAGTFRSNIQNDAPVQILGITEYLRKESKANPLFNKYLRIAAQDVAELLVVAAKFEAASVSRNRQAMEVMKGMRARRDRVPTIKLDEKSAFQSTSRKFTSSRNLDTGRKVKRKVTRGDVFFGAEFGGGARPTTRQFLRHRGRSGYFFWPTVRKHKGDIADAYLGAIQKVLDSLADKPTSSA
jgi:hypothetical protein